MTSLCVSSVAAMWSTLMYLRRQDKPPLRIRLDVSGVPEEWPIAQVKKVVHEVGVMGAGDVAGLAWRQDEHRPAHVIEIDDFAGDRGPLGTEVEAGGGRSHAGRGPVATDRERPHREQA